MHESPAGVPFRTRQTSVSHSSPLSNLDTHTLHAQNFRLNLLLLPPYSILVLERGGRFEIIPTVLARVIGTRKSCGCFISYQADARVRSALHRVLVAAAPHTRRRHHARLAAREAPVTTLPSTTTTTTTTTTKHKHVSINKRETHSSLWV